MGNPPIKLINRGNLISILVTADFRDPLPKGGEGVGGDRDEPEGGEHI